MHNQEDILRKVEELCSGNIHDAALRYFGGEMSGAEHKAFDLVMEKHPDLKEEVQLQGFALRAAKVAGRTAVLDKLEQASIRAKERAANRRRKRLRRSLLGLMLSAIAVSTILALFFGWGFPSGSSRPIRYADVNSFGLLHPPRAADAVAQASLYRIPGTEVGFVKVPGSFRLGFLPLARHVGLAWLPQERKSLAIHKASSDEVLRQRLCAEMRRLGLPIQDPVRFQNRRLEEEQHARWAGRVLNYPLLTGFISEEDPMLDVSYATQLVTLPGAPATQPEAASNWHRPQKEALTASGM